MLTNMNTSQSRMIDTEQPRHDNPAKKDQSSKAGSVLAIFFAKAKHP